MAKIIGCSPQISEGEKVSVIKKILHGVERNKNISLITAHSFKSYNRTNVFFIGPPDEVQNCAYSVVKNANELADMPNHNGDHPRIGMIDTLAFIPISNSTLEECTSIAKSFGKKIAHDFSIPVFYYAAAAVREEYEDLSNLRDQEYEGLKSAFEAGEVEPDLGPHSFNDRFGAIAIGAHNHHVQLSISINTNNYEVADEVAKLIREEGIEKDDGTVIEGKLKALKAIGMKKENDPKASILMVLLDLEKTPLHQAYLETKRTLVNKGYDIEFSEIQSTIPHKSLIDAGQYFSKIRNKSFSKDKELIRFALDEMKVKNFNQNRKIIST